MVPGLLMKNLGAPLPAEAEGSDKQVSTAEEIENNGKHAEVPAFGMSVMGV